MKINQKKKGFTLIELIVVIAILGILAAIAIPKIGGFTESAKETSDKEFAAIVANSAAQYLAGHQEITNVDATVAAGHITGDELVVRLAAAGLVKSTYTTQANLDGDLKSKEYVDGDGITITYASGVVTVVMDGNLEANDYTITK